MTLRRYRAGRLVDSRSDALTANPGESESDLLGRAVAAIASDIESGWKKEPAARYDQEGSLTAVLPITGLDDWVRARDRLGGRSGDPQDCSGGAVAAGGDDRDRLRRAGSTS